MTICSATLISFVDCNLLSLIPTNVRPFQHETQTQICVGLPKPRACRCRKESRDPFMLSISGPQDLVDEAWNVVKWQLAKEVGGPRALETMYRERYRFHADLPANTAAAKNALPPAFIYPLVYWPSGARIRLQDINDRDR